MADIEKCAALPVVRGPSLEGEAYDNLNRRSALQSADAPLLSANPGGFGPADGGLRAWLTVFGAFLALFCTFGQMNAFGTFQSWYSDHQLSQFSAFTISWIGSLQLWVFFFMGGPIGRVFDAYGPTPIMITGAFIYVFSLMMTSLSTKYYQYVLCQGILFGAGVGMLFYPSLAAVSTHFQRYRATALGVAAAGSSLGGVVYPIMLQCLFRAIGFGWTVRVSGLISAICCLVAILTVKSRLPTGKISSPWADTRIFKDKAFMLLVAGSFCVCLGFFTPFFYIVDYTQGLSVPRHTAIYVLSIMNAGGVFGRIAPACISDVIGRFNILTPSAFLAGLTCLVFWMFSQSLVSIMIFAAVYGFLSGAFISLVTPCVAQISDIREIGTRIGVLYTLISLPSLFGGPIAGALLTREHESYVGAIALSGTSMIIGSLLILGSKMVQESRILARV